MALLPDCTELTNCALTTSQPCASGPNANLTAVGMAVGDYLCACQEERPIWTYESPNRKWKHAFLRKLFFGTTVAALLPTLLATLRARFSADLAGSSLALYP